MQTDMITPPFSLLSIPTIQPLTYKAHEAVSSSTLHATGLKPQLIHLAITSAFLLMGFVIANLIPFFADMQGIISAFAASPIVFFFPGMPSHRTKGRTF